MLPIERACYWLAGLPERTVTPLAGTTESDIVVIGAGLTGLWTALFLKELDPSQDIAVVEQGIAAYGASGRNAGMLSETVDHSHALAIQHFGTEAARTLARLGAANVAEMESFLAERKIACDYEATGRLMVALTPAQVEEGRRSVEIARSLGIESYRELSADAVRAGDTEAKGVASALALADESKLPVFVTVCFFTPILLLLLASFSSIWDPWSLAELLALQLVVLDIAFYLCSGERRQLT